MPHLRGPFPSCDFFLSPKDVLALGHGAIGVDAAENRASAANVAVIRDNEPAEIGDAIVIIHHQRRSRLNR